MAATQRTADHEFVLPRVIRNGRTHKITAARSGSCPLHWASASDFIAYHDVIQAIDRDMNPDEDATRRKIREALVASNADFTPDELVTIVRHFGLTQD